MHELLADGGMIRKLWLGETAKYRDHLLRLDAQSRRNRFGLAAADEVIEAYMATSSWAGAVLHGFVVDGVVRAVAGVAAVASTSRISATRVVMAKPPVQRLPCRARLLG